MIKTAERKLIIETDSFLKLPFSSQALYFHLACRHKYGWSDNAIREMASLIGVRSDSIEKLIEEGFIFKASRGGEYYTYGLKETDSYQGLRGTAKYQKWRNAVIKRDKCCKNCGSTENLQAHHIKPFCDYPELAFDVNNGMTLCRKCHLGW